VAFELTLEGLTVSWLTKFIRQQLEQFPVQSYTTLAADDLTVVNKLIVADQVEFSTSKVFRFVGSQGAPAFVNGWINYGSPYSNAGYLKSPDGWVRLVGVIKSGTVGSAAFTLPAGLHPATLKSLLTLSNGVAGRVDIGSDGSVTPLSPSNNASVVLDNLQFKAA
jgi:hypothetical protein